MSQSSPRVRNACEACHTRKQRCILPEAGGPCHSCRQHARNCFFVPRIRPGKPRRDTNPGLGRPNLAASNDSSGVQSLSDTTSPFPGLGANFDGFAYNNARPGLDSRLESAVADLSDKQDDQDDLDSLWDTGFDFNLPESGIGLPGPLLTSDERSPLSRRSTEPSYHLQASAGASSNLTASAAATVAGHFIELDAQREMLQARSGSSEKTGDVRSKVESALLILASKACPQALDMTAEPANDRDLSRDAIVTGTMMRAFDLCEIILRMLEDQPGHHQSLGSGAFVGPSSTPTMSQPGRSSHPLHAQGAVRLVLTLKQLELNLTQAKMCLTFLAPSTLPQLANGLANRCASLQKRINTMVGGVCA